MRTFRTYTLTDENTGAVATGVDSNDIAAVLLPWFDGAPQRSAVLAVIDDLERKVRRGEHYGEEEAYLMVTVAAESAP